MATQMPPPSPRMEKRRLPGTANDLEGLASPSKRGTPTSRSFFAGAEVTRNHADVGWTRESAGSTPRALDRDFVAAEAGNSNAAVGGGVVGTANARTSTAATPRGKMYNRRTWTKEENEHLQAGIASLGGDDGEIGKNEWTMIAHEFLKDSRTGTQCATHWKMVLKPALQKGVWSAEEDRVIYDCVARGVTDWSEIASNLPKRKPKHCRERWNNHLDPAISKTELTPTEEAKLTNAVEVHGTNWAKVAKVLPGRSESILQQHWNAALFRNATKSAATTSTSTAGVRRGRAKAESTSTGPAQTGSRSRSKSSSLAAEPVPAPLPPTQDGRREKGAAGSVGDTGRKAGAASSIAVPDGAATLTDREKALIDHAFKTGLSAATGSNSVAHVAPDMLDAISKGNGGIERLTLQTEEEDVLAPLTEALLKTEDSNGCTPEMPPPSPTMSPLKSAQQPDYTALGNQLMDGWGADEDPALAELYRSLDNIGESLFNEDNFELSFDFDSVDKPSAGTSCGAYANLNDGVDEAVSATVGKTLSPPKNWESTLAPLSGQLKEESPFRRAAAQAAASMGQPQNPSSSEYNGQSQGQGLEAACARAAAAAAAAQAAAAAAAAAASTSGSGANSQGIQSKTGLSTGPRVKQGFLRRLLPPDSGKQSKQPCSTFSTIRGCLSEANAPLSPPSEPSSAFVSSGSRADSISTADNRLPWKGQRLSVALFMSPFGVPCDGEGIPVATLKHGKAEAKVAPSGGEFMQGSSLCSLMPSSSSILKYEIDPGWEDGQTSGD